MRCLLILLAAAGLTVCGCKKQGTVTPAPAADSINNASANPPGNTVAPGIVEQPLPPPPAYVAAVAENVPQQAVAGEVNVFLTQQLRIFIKQKGRLPTSFAEFTAIRLDSTPGPPAGKKWVIDISSQEVKAVAAK